MFDKYVINPSAIEHGSVFKLFTCLQLACKLACVYIWKEMGGTVSTATCMVYQIITYTF